MTMNDQRPVTELATFRARPGVPRAEVERALALAQPWLEAQPGFLSRQLSRDDRAETWVDVVSWRSAEDAERAMAAFAAAPFAAALEGVVDAASFRCLHATAVALPSPGAAR